MRRITGHLYRLPGRLTWMIAYYGNELSSTGRRRQIRESSKTDDEKKARKLLDKRLREVQNERDGIADFENPEARRVTCGKILDELFADFTARQIKGLGDVEYKIRKGSPLRNWFGDVRVSNLRPSMVDGYIAARRGEGKANATINRDVELLRQALKLAVERGRVVKAPRKLASRLPERNARQGFFEKAELDRLLPIMVDLELDPVGDITRFGFLTGWREGEILGLRWEAVTKVEVRLWDSKNGEPRSVPLVGELAEVVERRRRGRNFDQGGSVGLSAFIFHRGGRPIWRNVFGDQWRRACIKAGLGARVKDEEGIERYQGKRFHDLRRTFVRNAIRAGVPEAVVMKITGHKTRSMLDRYNITNDRDKVGALEAVQRYVEANPGDANVTAIENVLR